MSDPTATYLPGFVVGDWDATGVAADGTLWVLEDADGWDDAPDVRIDFADRVGVDGAFDAPGNYEARQITLSGAAVNPDRARLQQAKDTLRAVARNLGALSTLVGTDVLGARQLSVKRSGQLKIDPLGDAAFRYELVLTAPDPVLYGIDEQSVTTSLIDLADTSDGDWKFPMTFPYGFAGAGTGAGVMVARNEGNVTSWPVFRFNGPGTGLTVAHRGQAVTVTNLGAGNYLVVDMAAHSALLQGDQPRRDLIAPGPQWFGLEPGDNTVSFYASVYSSATVTMTWRSAWL